MEGVTNMPTQSITFSHYETADYLQTNEDIAAYLEAIMEENDPALLTAALGDIARARNMTKLAKDVGMSREGLYKALSGEGNPAYATISKVANALGLRLTIETLTATNHHNQQSTLIDCGSEMVVGFGQ